MKVDFGTEVREVKAWEPMALKDCKRLATATAMFLDFLRLFLLVGSFVGSIFFVGGVLKRPPSLLKDPVWYCVLIAFITIAFSTLQFVLQRSHAKRRLVIFENGIRFGSSFVAFDDIDRISTGQFKTAMEKYVPTLEKAAVYANNPLLAEGVISGAAKARQLIRDNSVTIFKKTGKQVHWVGMLSLFTDEDILEFFKLIREKAPSIRLSQDTTESAAETSTR